MKPHKKLVLTAVETETSDGASCHCPCGALQCRLTERGVEIKCRKCKRVVVVPLTKS
jgi:hypothetical protein